MKIKLFLVLIFFSVKILAQDELKEKFNYKAIYKLEYQEDSTDENSIKSETMVLYLGEGHSRFSSLGKAVEDSLKTTLDPSNKSMAELQRVNSLTPETDFNYKLFKKYKEEEIVLAEIYLRDKLKYHQLLKTVDWEIQQDSKEILGYKVQKATGFFAGRNYVAWFAPELPFSDGPYKFNGLPGLILEISDLKNHYHFTLTGFQKLEPPVDKLLDLEKYKLVSQKELDQFRDDYKRDPFTAMESIGVTIEWVDDKQEAKMKRDVNESYKRENNPIELQP